MFIILENYTFKISKSLPCRLPTGYYTEIIQLIVMRQKLKKLLNNLYLTLITFNMKPLLFYNILKCNLHYTIIY